MTELAFLHGWAARPDVWPGQEQCFGWIISVNYHMGVNNVRCNNGGSAYAKAAVDLINRETAVKPVLVGWSLGAMVALEVAHLAPERIRGLVLVSGTSCFTQAPGYAAGMPRVVVERLKKRLARNVEQTLHDFNSLMFTTEEQSTGFAESFRLQNSSYGRFWSREELETGLDYLLEQDLRQQLKDIVLPVLIIHGERDQICPAAAGLYLHQNLCNSQFSLLKDCGHVPFLTQAEAFKQRVGEWLNDNN